MQLKFYVFWGIVLCCIPYFLCAQPIEQFIQNIPIDQGKSLGVHRFSTILSIETDVRGLYVLTQKNGCYLIESNGLTDLELVVLPDDRRDYFFDLVSNQKNVFLWANGHEVLPLKGRLSDRLPYTSTFFSETVQANNIAIDTNGTIYVGTLSDGLFVFAKDEWGDYSNLATRISTFENELPSNIIQCLYQDSNDIIWVGTSEGVASIANGKVKNLSKRELLPQTWWQKFLGRERERPVFSESIHAIASWGESMLFAGEDDLYKASVSGDSLQYFFQYNLPNRLANPLSDIKELLVDIDGNVWIAGNQLIHFNITRDQLSVMSDLHYFRGQGFLSIAEDVATEKIWVGTNKGGLYKLDYPNPNKGIGY